MNLEPLGPGAKKLLENLQAVADQFADEEVPGWIIGKPSLSELNSDLAVLSARPKPDDHAVLFTG
ncbi:MAG TPA: hypothetical protein VGF86_11265 [Candidatus Tumulicola sp.]